MFCCWCGILVNPLSTGTHFCHEFWVWSRLLLTSERVYGGHKINGHSLQSSNPHMIFWSCRKSINNIWINMKNCFLVVKWWTDKRTFWIKAMYGWKRLDNQIKTESWIITRELFVLKRCMDRKRCDLERDLFCVSRFYNARKIHLNTFNTRTHFYINWA